MGKDGADGTIDLPVTRLGNIEDGAEVKTTLADADALPVVDSADAQEMKKISWANLVAAIKAKLKGMAPTAHKNSHKTGGSDALTAADIGALPKTGGRVDGWFGVIPGEYTEKLYVCQDGVFVGDGSYQDEREAPFQLPFLSGRPRIPSPVIPTEAANKEYVDAGLADKAFKSKQVSATIGTTWSGSAGAWTQTLNIAGVTATNVVEVFLAKEATDAQDKAYTALQLRDGGQSSGKITLKAKGAKNTITIPITVIVRGDL